MDLFDEDQIYYIVRIIVAGICGMLIGLERKSHSKEVGMRTHFVVACASALMMIISKYGFGDIVAGVDGMRGADGARIAAQVVSGIGFLGAGIIFIRRDAVTGLTTAAGIWATSGIGLAIGAGMYIIGIVTTVIIVIVLMLHKNFLRRKRSKFKEIAVNAVTEPNYQQFLTKSLSEYNITVYDVSIEKTADGCNYTFIADVPENMPEEDIISMINYECTINTFVR